MSNHTVKIIDDRNQSYGQCSCRYQTRFMTKQDAEDEMRKHLEQVERARAHLTTRTPQLKHQLEHYRKMENDPETNAHDRPLWKMLADELEQRLGSAPIDTPLF